MKVLLTVAALLAASQAQALSCIRPDPVTSFDHANTSASPYMVMTGTLTAPPASGMTESKPVSPMPKLTGQGLAQDLPLIHIRCCRRTGLTLPTERP